MKINSALFLGGNCAVVWRGISYTSGIRGARKMWKWEFNNLWDALHTLSRGARVLSRLWARAGRGESLSCVLPLYCQQRARIDTAWPWKCDECAPDAASPIGAPPARRIFTPRERDSDQENTSIPESCVYVCVCYTLARAPCSANTSMRSFFQKWIFLVYFFSPDDNFFSVKEFLIKYNFFEEKFWNMHALSPSKNSDIDVYIVSLHANCTFNGYLQFFHLYKILHLYQKF